MNFSKNYFNIKLANCFWAFLFCHIKNENNLVKMNSKKQNQNTSVDDIKSEYIFYFLGNLSNLSNYKKKPFGKEIVLIDPYKKDNFAFIDLLNQMDGLSYGNKSLAMEKWVALDCGILPSGFIGLAKKRLETPNYLLKKFNFSKGYEGLVPITEYCAIPSADKNTWIGHTCATLEKGAGLGLFSKLLGLEFFQIKKYLGVAQYHNTAVKTHAKISDLNLKTALTPAHSDPEMTFIYSQEIPHNLESVMNKKNEVKYDFLLDSFDHSAKEELQKKIESGNNYAITFPGQIFIDNKLYIPLIQNGGKK